MASGSKSIEERHPELFAKDLKIDPRTRTRVVPMEVMALGMSRTGTACKSHSQAHSALIIPSFFFFFIFFIFLISQPRLTATVRECSDANGTRDSGLRSMLAWI